MRSVFFGTPEPAADLLQTLITAGEDIVYVVTQPDRPKGRGQKVGFSPVKELALKYAFAVEQPIAVKNHPVFIAWLKSLNPDIAIVVAYGKILPKEILVIPKYGFINVHASLLPKYRGAAPIQWALLNGEKETGISIFKIVERLDAGPIVAQKRIEVELDDNYEILEKKLFIAAKPLLLTVLKEIQSGKAKYSAQNEADATFAPAISKESGEIDWRKSAFEIHNRIRALVAWPATYTFYKEKRLKILKSRVNGVDLAAGEKLPGTIAGIIKGEGFIVATGNGNLQILEVQLEGRKRMNAYNFALGHAIRVGEAFPN